MAGVTVFHNPACSKCRGTLEIVRDSGVPYETIEYPNAPRPITRRAIK